MILEVDVGNTRVKWRLLSDGVVLERGFEMTVELTSIDDVDSCFVNIAVSRLTEIHIATVVLSYRKLFTLWAAQYSLAPVFVQTSGSCRGVINAYKEVDQMGVDRWLAIVAAYEKVCGACFIIDAGSAVTIDIVKEGGQHLGGYIVPGLHMMRHSLFGQTDQVGDNAGKASGANVCTSKSVSPGKSTQTAVSSGLPLMLLGMIHWLLLDFKDTSDARPSILVTGGDGAFLKGLLSSNGITGVRCVPELVMDGLSLVVND
jgi:type III pantothenate kinase